MIDQRAGHNYNFNLKSVNTSIWETSMNPQIQYDPMFNYLQFLCTLLAVVFIKWTDPLIIFHKLFWCSLKLSINCRQEEHGVAHIGMLSLPPLTLYLKTQKWKFP